MNIRELRTEDLPTLQAIGKANGFEYVDPKAADIESALVVVDDNGRFLMACAAERIVQLYLWSAEFEPAAKLHALRLLHREMSVRLRERGYESCEAFLPPQIEASFGRRLMRNFGWTRNWNSFCKRF